MKNLKKVLALGLALVMLLGMFTLVSADDTATATTAEGFNDWAAVEHQDAVSLLVNLGVINGKLGNVFDPTGTIDRASWSKMVAIVATGKEQNAGVTSALKDISDSWAAGSISYLYSKGIVSGDNVGNFYPTRDVSVAEAAKMLLTAIGWDAEDRGYVYNDAWDSNIMADASDNRLMNDVAWTTTNEPLSRDNAAQMIFNALEATTKDPIYLKDNNGDRYVYNYRSGDSLGYKNFKLIKVTGVVSELKADGTAVFDYITPTAVGVNNVSEKIAADLSYVGQQVNLWVTGTKTTSTNNAGDVVISSVKFDKLVSTSLALNSSAPLKTVTSGVKFANAFTVGHDDYVGVKGSSNYITYYLNGKEAGSRWYDSEENKWVAVYPNDARKGDVVEFYDIGGYGYVDTVKVYAYSVTKLTSAPKTKTVDGELQVQIPGIITAFTPATQVTGWEDLAKDDVVLWYKHPSEAVYNLEKAEFVTGTPTKVTNKGVLTVGSATYEKSGLVDGKVGAVTNWADWSDFDNEYNFYLDKNGTVCRADKTTNNVTGNVAYALQTNWAAGASLASSNFAEAELLFADGTVEVVTVADILTQGDSVAKLEDAVAGNEGAGVFYTYSVNSKGEYTLTVMEDVQNDDDENVSGWGDPIGITVSANIVQKANFVDKVTTYAANNNTVFLVQKGKTDDNGKAKGTQTYEAYVGFANLPKMAQEAVRAGSVGVAKAGESVLAYVFIGTSAYADDAPEGYVFLRDANFTFENADSSYAMNVVDANGNEATLKVNAAVKTAMVAAGANSFFSIDTVEDGIVTKLGKAVTTAGLTSLGAGVIKTDDNATNTINDDTVVVVIDLNKKGEYEAVSPVDPSEIDSIDTADSTYVSVNVAQAASDGVASYVYIVRRVINPTPNPEA